MQMAFDNTQVAQERRSEAFETLDALRATVERLCEDLLDFNPLLAVMAGSLQQALDLEIEARRCNLLRGDPL